jgi:hypothetical protein
MANGIRRFAFTFSCGLVRSINSLSISASSNSATTGQRATSNGDDWSALWSRPSCGRRSIPILTPRQNSDFQGVDRTLENIGSRVNRLCGRDGLSSNFKGRSSWRLDWCRLSRTAFGSTLKCGAGSRRARHPGSRQGDYQAYCIVRRCRGGNGGYRRSVSEVLVQ